MDDFFNLLAKEDLTDYAPIPFWSWNNELEKDRLIKQIHEMKSVGCGGFIIHARTGLRTEYLSEQWFDMVRACLNEAKSLKMNVWIYDENGWPSGFVGGKLLEREENLASYLVKEERYEFDPKAFAVFEKTKNGMKRLDGTRKCADGVYHTVYVRRSPANTDILNPKVVSQFIAETHEKYYARFKESFGKELVGFFTDEPQYFRERTPFTPVVAEFWCEEYGEDIADGIIYLFEDDEESYPFRVRYYKALNRLYTENYYKRLYDWCEAHDCKLTGHSVEETKLYTQMWGCAGCTPSYEYEHIPGIDNLAKNGPAKLSARQVGSAAGQLGKKQILTETFGCCGYDVTPKQLKAIAEKQYVHGVNLLCHHLYPYSLAGQGKTDHPPCFSPHMTWWKQFSEFNLYFTRLGWMLANSEACVNCTVISPLSSVYLRYDRLHEASAFKTDEAFERLQAELNKWGILYDITDETILRNHGNVKGKKLNVGKRNYDFVIIPESENLSADTKRILKEFLASGGKILACGMPAYTDGNKDSWAFLKSNVAFSEIAAAGKIRMETDGNAEYSYRKGENFEFLYVVNVEKETARIVVPSGFSRVDLLTLEAFEMSSEILLEEGESIILMPVKGKGNRCFGEEKEIVSGFCFKGVTDNNLTLDRVRISFDGENFEREEPLAAAFDRLLRSEYNGKLFVKYAFEATGFGKRLVIRREKGKFISSRFNGCEIKFRESAFDFNFEEADITNFVVTGRNEYVNELKFYNRPQVFWALYDPEATESVRNCLWYDTEIENVYVLGDFRVDDKRRIGSPYIPAGTARLHKFGFPNFAGKILFSTKIFGEKKHAKLKIQGDYTVAEISVNGKSAGHCLFGNTVEIEWDEGKENRLDIAIVSSLRNMFGPFHFNGSEENINPFQFTFRGSWKEGNSRFYDADYRLQPFGLDSVTIAFEQ